MSTKRKSGKRMGRPTQYDEAMELFVTRLPKVARECLEERAIKEGRSAREIAREILIKELKPCTKGL